MSMAAVAGLRPLPNRVLYATHSGRTACSKTPHRTMYAPAPRSVRPIGSGRADACFGGAHRDGDLDVQLGARATPPASPPRHPAWPVTQNWIPSPCGPVPIEDGEPTPVRAGARRYSPALDPRWNSRDVNVRPTGHAQPQAVVATAATVVPVVQALEPESASAAHGTSPEPAPPTARARSGWASTRRV